MTKHEEGSAKYIYGLRPVLEAIETDKSIEKIFVKKGLQRSTLSQIHKTLQQRPIHVQRVPKSKLDQLVQANHQGIVARITPIQFQSLEDVLLQAFESGEAPLFVISDKITDVHNLGAIARTAECFGAHGLIIPAKGGAPINQDAIKVSTGAFYRLPICREKNYTTTIAYLAESGMQVIGATEQSETPVNKADLTQPTALIMGAEDTGIPPEHLEDIDTTVHIPLPGHTHSLNVSAATAVCLYEVQRQRR